MKPFIDALNEVSPTTWGAMFIFLAVTLFVTKHDAAATTLLTTGAAFINGGKRTDKPV